MAAVRPNAGLPASSTHATWPACSARLAHRLSRPVADRSTAPRTRASASPVLDFSAAYEHGLTHFVKKHVTSYYGVSRAAAIVARHTIKASGVWYNAVTPSLAVTTTVTNASGYARSGFENRHLYAGRLIAEKGIVALLDAAPARRAARRSAPA